jgi:hypothetical protein
VFYGFRASEPMSVVGAYFLFVNPFVYKNYNFVFFHLVFFVLTDSYQCYCLTLPFSLSYKTGSHKKNYDLFFPEEWKTSSGFYSQSTITPPVLTSPQVHNLSFIFISSLRRRTHSLEINFKGHWGPLWQGEKTPDTTTPGEGSTTHSCRHWW